MSSPVFYPTVDELATLLEEGSRASAQSVQRFVEPMAGTVRRAQSRRHHVVFGRRGSGKSSLLFKTVDSLNRDEVPVAYVDLEPLKGHHYPDVLISVLLVALTKFSNWLGLRENFRGRRTWYTLWLRKKRTESSQLKYELEQLMGRTIVALRHELHLADAAQLIETRGAGKEATESAKTKGSAKVGLQALDTSLETEIASQAVLSETQEIREEHKRSKVDFLHRSILDYHRIFDMLNGLTGKDCFLFLDDLYHITRGDQAKVLDYFHRIAKGHNLWLKIGTIKHRSTWYVHSPQPIGLKIGDDADDINLDLTLEKFSTTRSFLSQVAETYISEAEAPLLRELISDGGLDRLVMASGGVARDSLGILRRSIDEARERLTRNPQHSRGDKIGAEDVNMATGTYGETKMEEFQKDTLEDQKKLHDAFMKIRLFCLDKAVANIFLIDQEVSTEDSDLVQELIDLRLVHHVRSRVTVSARPGRAYRALLLDVSQYTGERKRRNFEMIEFWKEDRELLRRANLIYDPGMSVDRLRDEISQNKKDPHTQKDDKQLDLGLKF
jgi:hypothetical protein